MGAPARPVIITSIPGGRHRAGPRWQRRAAAGAGSQCHYARLLAGRRPICPADKAGLYLHRSTKRAISVFDEGPLTPIYPLNCPSLISDQRRQHNSASRHCARSRRLTYPRLLHCSQYCISISHFLPNTNTQTLIALASLCWKCV